VYPGRGLCETGCRTDLDCDGRLVCFKREDDDELVPGCPNIAESESDVCVDPNAPTVKEDVVGEPYWRLKMYGWEKTSSSHEGKYCAECDGSCRDGQGLDIGSCDSGSEKWHFINTSLDGMTTMVKEEDKDLCWRMEDGSTRLADCDPTDQCQTFNAGKGNYNGFRFEFKSTCANSRCVTQDHYPRSGEELEGSNCWRARRHKSSFWEKW